MDCTGWFGQVDCSQGRLMQCLMWPEGVDLACGILVCVCVCFLALLGGAAQHVLGMSCCFNCLLPELGLGRAAECTCHKTLLVPHFLRVGHPPGWVPQHFASSILSPGRGASHACAASWMQAAVSCHTYWIHIQVRGLMLMLWHPPVPVGSSCRRGDWDVL